MTGFSEHLLCVLKYDRIEYTTPYRRPPLGTRDAVGRHPITGGRRRHERRARIERATGIARSATARALASAAAAARGAERRRHAGARGRDVRPRR